MSKREEPKQKDPRMEALLDWYVEVLHLMLKEPDKREDIQKTDSIAQEKSTQGRTKHKHQTNKPRKNKP